MHEKKYGLETRHECWLKGHEESKKFNSPDSMFGSAEALHLFGELYYRIEELEKQEQIQGTSIANLQNCVGGLISQIKGLEEKLEHLEVDTIYSAIR